MSSEDEDEFLYGTEAPSAKRQKTDLSTEAAPAAAPQLVDGDEGKGGRDDGDDDGDDGDEVDEDEDDSDSDVEFVINTKPGQAVEVPKSSSYSVKTEDSSATKAASSSTAAAAAGEGGDENAEGGAVATTERAPALDINAVAVQDGKPITQIPLESYESKPWRQPGADSTDYFNFGFDEFTWTAYCSKQDNLHDEYSPQKVMNKMMMGGMPGAVPGPDMGMMPPEMMQQMMAGFMGMGQMPPMPMPQQQPQQQYPQQQQQQYQQHQQQYQQPAMQNQDYNRDRSSTPSWRRRQH